MLLSNVELQAPSTIEAPSKVPAARESGCAMMVKAIRRSCRLRGEGGTNGGRQGKSLAVRPAYVVGMVEVFAHVENTPCQPF
jgi:hypothetical protein